MGAQMRSPRAVVLAVMVGIVSRPADGATLLYALSDPGEAVLGGQSRRFTAADAVFAAVPFEGGVYVTVDATHPWGIVFAPPVGQTLGTGAYEDAEFIATADRPALRIGAEHVGCNDIDGRFVLLDLVKGPGDTIVSFAADFEQQCAFGTGTLRGSIRYHVGDAGCAAAADGTPCDDILDACTATAACFGGACVPGDGPPRCSVRKRHVPSLCDPTTGTCGVSAFAPSRCCCADGRQRLHHGRALRLRHVHLRPGDPDVVLRRRHLHRGRLRPAAWLPARADRRNLRADRSSAARRSS